MDYSACEFDNKSSVVVAILPGLSDRPEKQVNYGHTYAVIDYSSAHKAVKLYNPNCVHSVSDKRLPLSLTMNANADKGEFWVSIDRFERRFVEVTSLYPKTMFKSVFQYKPKVKTYPSDKNTFIATYSCKITVTEASMFMINLFSFQKNTWNFTVNLNL